MIQLVLIGVVLQECSKRVAARKGHPTIPFEGEDLGYALPKSRVRLSSIL